MEDFHIQSKPNHRHERISEADHDPKPYQWYIPLEKWSFSHPKTVTQVTQITSQVAETQLRLLTLTIRSNRVIRPQGGKNRVWNRAIRLGPTIISGSTIRSAVPARRVPGTTPDHKSSWKIVSRLRNQPYPVSLPRLSARAGKKIHGSRKQAFDSGRRRPALLKPFLP